MKKDIDIYVTIIESKSSLIVPWVKVSKILFDTTSDILKGRVYIPPKQTRFVNKQTGVQLVFFYAPGFCKLFGALGSPSSGSLLNLLRPRF